MKEGVRLLKRGRMPEKEGDCMKRGKYIMQIITRYSYLAIMLQFSSSISGVFVVISPS